MVRENEIKIKNTDTPETRIHHTGLVEVCHMNAHLGGRVFGLYCLRTVSAIQFNSIIFEYANVIYTLLAIAHKHLYTI